MIRIVRVSIKKKYRYLWLKHINGIDLSQHCAKCLLGEYDERINNQTQQYEDIVLPDSKYHYLCGVLNYYDNLHIAFREKDGESIRINDDKIDVEIENAELLPISNRYIDWKLPKAMLKSYNTCRNWQFANWVNCNEAKDTARGVCRDR